MDQQKQVYLKTMHKENIEKNSIEDLDLLLKGLKDNKETIGILNKLQELQERIYHLEQLVNRLSTPNQYTGQSTASGGPYYQPTPRTYTSTTIDPFTKVSNF